MSRLEVILLSVIFGFVFGILAEAARTDSVIDGTVKAYEATLGFGCNYVR